MPKPPAEAPPANRPSAVLRHHHLLSIQQQQNTSNNDNSLTSGRLNSDAAGNNGIHTTNLQQPLHNTTNNTNSKNFSSTNELNRHQKLPQISGVQLNSILD